MLCEDDLCYGRCFIAEGSETIDCDHITYYMLYIIYYIGIDRSIFITNYLKRKNSSTIRTCMHIIGWLRVSFVKFEMNLNKVEDAHFSKDQ